MSFQTRLNLIFKGRMEETVKRCFAEKKIKKMPHTPEKVSYKDPNKVEVEARVHLQSHCRCRLTTHRTDTVKAERKQEEESPAWNHSCRMLTETSLDSNSI